MDSITEKFNRAWEYLKKNEGGYSDNLYDGGGATKYGISLRFLQNINMNYRGDVTATIYNGDVNGDGKVDKEDIILLNSRTAKALYKAYFWVPSNCEAMNNVKIAIKLFDMAVNYGVGTAAKIMQRALNNICKNQTLNIDGVIGPKTIGVINKANSVILMQELVKLCKEKYNNIVEKNSSQKVFLKGWLKRAERVPV